MKKLIKFLVAGLLLFSAATVSAEVYTVNSTNKEKTAVLVVGNPDFYPIEYYNKLTGEYEGLVPEMLKTVSLRTGFDFKYLHSKTPQKSLSQKVGARLVTAYEYDDEEYADVVPVFTYVRNGKTVDVNIAFTEHLEADKLNKIKTELNNITDKEKKGYIVAVSNVRQERSKKWVVISVLFFVITVLLIASLIIILKWSKKRIFKNNMTDDETGIGNLLYFEKEYENKVDMFDEGTYYVAYIIIDSAYLHIHHTETVFLDTIKYSADLISEYTGEEGVASRIAENGFAMMFNSIDEDAAKAFVQEIVEKITSFVAPEKKLAVAVVHSAVYKLGIKDRNCGYLLFNLRRNCSKLLGDNIEVVVLDSQAMNNLENEKIFYETILDAFEKKEFKLYLQFIVKNKTKEIVSAEALSRWETSDGEIRTPGRYIAEMEANGTISKLDYYMFEMVCRQLHKWKDSDMDSLTISCNITRITLSEADFIAHISDIAKRYVFDKTKLIIEITEDAIEENREIVMKNVLKCKELGFRIALDDLGSGYTSLINLCEYPIDIVKLDRDVLLQTDRKNGYELFKGAVALAHSLNLEVVCEGVETEEQNEFVSGTDCDYIQGWYYSTVYQSRTGDEFVREYRARKSNSEEG